MGHVSAPGCSVRSVPKPLAGSHFAPAAAADDDDEEDDEEQEERAAKRSWFKCDKGETQAEQPAKVSGARAYMVVVKFVIIVFVSFGIATATTLIYQRFLA